MRMIEDNRILSCGNIRRYIRNKNIISNYTQLEYIQNTGIQWIDTGVYPNQTIKIQIELTCYGTTGGAIIGNDSADDNNDYRLFNYTDNHWYYDFKDQRCIDGLRTVSLGTKYLLELGNNYIKDVNSGTILVSGSSISQFSSSTPIYIFKATGGASYTLHSLKMWLNNVLVRNYIPCIDNSAEENMNIGLYDKVTKTFTCGTGYFYAGPEIPGSSFSPLIETEDFDNRPANMNYLDKLLKGNAVNDILSISDCPVSAYAFKKILSNIKPYTQLQWIEGTGQQWIDTGVIPNENTVIRIKFMGFEGTGDALVGFMTEPYNDDNKDYRLFNHQDDYLWYWDIQSSRLKGGRWKEYTVHNVEAGNNYLKDLDTSQNILSGNKVGAFTTTYTIRLLKASDSAVHVVKARIYSLEILQGSTSVRNYIPVKMNDGNVGLYDLVNSEFYGSQGPSEFVAGPTIGEPEPPLLKYTKLEYITFNGSEYIDTGVQLYTSKIDMDVDISSQNPYTPIGMFGASNSYNFSFNLFRMNPYQFRYDYDTASATINHTATGRLHIVADRNYFYINDVLMSTLAFSVFKTPCNCVIGSINVQGLIDSRRLKGNLYSFKIYTEGNLVRDFIPVKTLDNQIGLWDLVEDKFYGNAGTGSFVAGPEI